MSRPIYQIVADGNAITDAIADRLLELSITDEAGIESDALSMKLDDRPRSDGAQAEMPMPGTQLEVHLSYLGEEWVSMGLYIVDEIELSSPPATLSLTAKAADMTGEFRTQTTRSWHETALGEIITGIAGKHGYTPRIDPELAAVQIPHIDQGAESDMSFLTRLSKQYDAVAKPIAGALVFARRGMAKSVSGEDLPVVELRLDQLTSWRFKSNARMSAGVSTGFGGIKTILGGLLGDVFGVDLGGESGASSEEEDAPKGGTRAYWWDFETGERKEVTTGAEPFEDLRQVYSSEEEAKAAAGTNTNEGTRQEARLSFTLPGDPRLAAEGRVSLTLRDQIPTDWRITRAEHRISARGWTTSCECEMFSEEQDAVV
jgi:phage protein D